MYRYVSDSLGLAMMRMQRSGFVFGFRDLLWVSRGQYLIFGTGIIRETAGTGIRDNRGIL